MCWALRVRYLGLCFSDSFERGMTKVGIQRRETTHIWHCFGFLCMLLWFAMLLLNHDSIRYLSLPDHPLACVRASLGGAQGRVLMCSRRVLKNKFENDGRAGVLIKHLLVGPGNSWPWKCPSRTSESGGRVYLTEFQESTLLRDMRSFHQLRI